MLTATAGTQPVLVLRDDEGELRAFRNVCRHRGSRLLAGSGECGKAIRCRYHGWTYRIDGELIGVPEARSIPGSTSRRSGCSRRASRRSRARVREPRHPRRRRWPSRWRGFRSGSRPTASRAWCQHKKLDGSQPANWKIVVDNYLEGYHVPIAHPGLMSLYDYKSYDVELFDNWAWFDAPLRDKPSGNLLERTYQRMVEPMPGLGHEHARVWHYILIYPNTTVDLYPDQIGIWQILPKGIDATQDVALTLLPHRVACGRAWRSSRTARSTSL